MVFLKRLICALPLLVLSPFLMAISFLALVLVQIFTRRRWHKAPPCASERSSDVRAADCGEGSPEASRPSFARMDKAEPYPTAATVVIPNWNQKGLLAKYI